jgi:uncharacterized protein YqjF (DUF2071 family)
MTHASHATYDMPQPKEVSSHSAIARRRLLSHRGEPLFLADWMRVLMIHFEIDAKVLQRNVPYELDLHEGRAFVTLVAFTMENMHPRFGGKVGAWFFKPIATHDFLNVRTYVRHNGEPGIHFLAEWLSNWLAVRLGPRTFGLPYRHGFTSYQHDSHSGRYCGIVRDVQTKTLFQYRAQSKVAPDFSLCEHDSFDEWLMERYTAFNAATGRKRFFRVWHPPWPQATVEVTIEDLALLEESWPFFKSARHVGANFSPGLCNVWMGRPQLVLPTVNRSCGFVETAV